MSEILVWLQSHAYVEAPLILAVALLAAFMVEWLVARVVPRFTRKTKMIVDDELIAALRRPLFLSVILVGAALALERVGATEAVRATSRSVLYTLAILVWTRAGTRMCDVLLAALARQADAYEAIQPQSLPLFRIVAKTLVGGGAVYGLMMVWQIDVTAWLASAGILGIAIGFAAKDTLGNFIAGIFILADAPYKIGDFIILDSGKRGRVTDIGMRSTRILTRDDIQIIIPNAAIANAKIVNETGGPHDMERVRVTIGVAYGSDIDQVRRVLMEVAAASTHMVAEPEPRVRFREFGDSSLNFQLLGWIDEPVLRGRAVDELNVAVYKRFMAEGIEIPFPQRDVHLHQA